MQIGYVRADWRDHPEIDANMIAVLAVLATYADREGLCWPSQGLLASKLKRSRAWVCGVLKELVSLGILTKLRRQDHDGFETSCLYGLLGHADILIPAVEESDTPTTAQENQDHSLSVGEAPEVVDAGVEIPANWHPSDADLATLYRDRPDLRDRVRQIGKSTRKFVGYYRDHGLRVGSVVAVWLRWMSREKLWPTKGPEAPQPAKDALRAAQNGSLEARNDAAAKACLERINARKRRS